MPKKKKVEQEETNVEEQVTEETEAVEEEVKSEETVNTYERQTPFGTEVWDPETKRTIMKRG